MKRLKIFVASSGTLADDRRELEIAASRLNDRLVSRNVYIDLWLWEKKSRAFSQGRKQDEFNKEIDSSDLFICLIFDSVGAFTEEEFLWAVERFKMTSRPRIVILFKSSLVDTTKITSNFDSVIQARNTVAELGQVWDTYSNAAELCLKFEREMHYLVESLGGTPEVSNDSYHISNQVIVDLVEPTGKLAYLCRKTHIKAMQPITQVFDRVTTDGELLNSSLTVCPGHITSVKKEDGAWIIETTLDETIQQGNQLFKTLFAELRNSFLSDSEYWMDRQLGLQSLTSIEIRFPKERPPISWIAHRTINYKELPPPTVRKYAFAGRIFLDLQHSGEVPYEILHLKWRW